MVGAEMSVEIIEAIGTWIILPICAAAAFVALIWGASK